MRIAGLKGKKKPLKKKILYHTHLYKIFSFFFKKKKTVSLAHEATIGIRFWHPHRGKKKDNIMV